MVYKWVVVLLSEGKRYFSCFALEIHKLYITELDLFCGLFIIELWLRIFIHTYCCITFFCRITAISVIAPLNAIAEAMNNIRESL